MNLLKLLKEKCYRKGNFKLSSGVESQHYINCKNVTLSGPGLRQVSTELAGLVEEGSVAVAGRTLGADPLVAGVAMVSNLDAFIIRKEPKGHGTQAWIEGPPQVEGAKVTVLEDVVTSGQSAIKAVEKLREAGYVVNRVVTIVDRQLGGEADINMCAAHLELYSLYSLEDFYE